MQKAKITLCNECILSSATAHFLFKVGNISTLQITYWIVMNGNVLAEVGVESIQVTNKELLVLIGDFSG